MQPRRSRPIGVRQDPITQRSASSRSFATMGSRDLKRGQLAIVWQTTSFFFFFFFFEVDLRRARSDEVPGRRGRLSTKLGCMAAQYSKVEALEAARSVSVSVGGDVRLPTA